MGECRFYPLLIPKVTSFVALRSTKVDQIFQKDLEAIETLHLCEKLQKEVISTFYLEPILLLASYIFCSMRDYQHNVNSIL